MAATGQASAKGSLQPAGRPVIAMTGRRACASACSADNAAGSIAPSRVSVSSMSVKTPATPASGASRSALAGGQGVAPGRSGFGSGMGASVPC
jgi:hypothetical protein